jgi:cytochrome b
MINFFILISLLITAFTGLKTLGSEGRGPLANNDISIVRPAFADEDEHNEGSANISSRRQTEQKSEFWEEIHEGMTGFIIFFVIVHVSGVIVSSWVHKENLILGMETGRNIIE